jgi:hypothetical protein
LNPETGEEIFQADAIKNGGPRIIGRGKDMTQAMANLIDELRQRGFTTI